MLGGPGLEKGLRTSASVVDPPSAGSGVTQFENFVWPAFIMDDHASQPTLTGWSALGDEPAIDHAAAMRSGEHMEHLVPDRPPLANIYVVMSQGAELDQLYPSTF